MKAGSTLTQALKEYKNYMFKNIFVRINKEEFEKVDTNGKSFNDYIVDILKGDKPINKNLLK